MMHLVLFFLLIIYVVYGILVIIQPLPLPSFLFANKDNNGTILLVHVACKIRSEPKVGSWEIVYDNFPLSNKISYA
jgi:hypothetical protein